MFSAPFWEKKQLILEIESEEKLDNINVERRKRIDTRGRHKRTFLRRRKREVKKERFGRKSISGQEGYVVEGEGV